MTRKPAKKVPDTRRSEADVDLGRRKFLRSAGTFFFGMAAGAAVIDNGLQATSRLASRLWDFRERILYTAGIDLPRRAELIIELLRLSGRLQIVSPTQHPLYGKPGPSDYAAMGAVSCLGPGPTIVDDHISVSLRDIDFLFSAGSPISSGLTANFVPMTLPSGIQSTQVVVNRDALPYHFWHGESDCLSLKSATQGGRARIVKNHGLVAKGAVWHPRRLADSEGRLTTDFLLLTVAPRNRGGGFVALASGGHGPGTRALELLFNPAAFPLRELEHLVDILDKAPGFQIVFEVEVTHEGPHSAPKSLRVSSQCPPEILLGAEALLAGDDILVTERLLGSPLAT